MPMMNIFEPLFLLLVLVTIITLVTAAVLALSGKLARAGRNLRRLAIGAAVYFAVVMAVSILSPRKVYHLGDTQCFDDWCIAVVDAKRIFAAALGPDALEKVGDKGVVEGPGTSSILLFYSYAPEDAPLYTDLEKHLKPLHRYVTVWHVGIATAGSD